MLKIMYSIISYQVRSRDVFDLMRNPSVCEGPKKNERCGCLASFVDLVFSDASVAVFVFGFKKLAVFRSPAKSKPGFTGLDERPRTFVGCLLAPLEVFTQRGYNGGCNRPVGLI